MNVRSTGPHGRATAAELNKQRRRHARKRGQVREVSGRGGAGGGGGSQSEDTAYGRGAGVRLESEKVASNPHTGLFCGMRTSPAVRTSASELSKVNIRGSESGTEDAGRAREGLWVRGGETRPFGTGRKRWYPARETKTIDEAMNRKGGREPQCSL